MGQGALAGVAGQRIEEMQKPSAVVFIANDKIFPQVLAFLESVRTNSPKTRLICIPYNDKFEKVFALQLHYNFFLWPMTMDPVIEQLSIRIYGDISPRLIKLQTFALPLYEFLMLDCDVIVLDNLDPIFNHTNADNQIVYMDESPGQSYICRDDPRLAASREFNTGTFLASNRYLDLRQISDAVMTNIDRYRAAARVSNDDQPVLNFAIDVLGLKARNFDEAGVGLSSEAWFLKDWLVEESPGNFRNVHSGKPVPLIHFAGYSSGGLQNAPRLAGLYLHYLERGCRRVGISVSQCQ